MNEIQLQIMCRNIRAGISYGHFIRCQQGFEQPAQANVMAKLVNLDKEG